MLVQRAPTGHARLCNGPSDMSGPEGMALRQDFLLWNYPCGRAMGSTKQKHGRKGFKQYQRDLDDFFLAFNGPRFGELFDMNTRVDRDSARANMVKGLLRVAFRSVVMGSPQTGPAHCKS